MYRVLLPSGIRVGNNIKDDQSFHLIDIGGLHEERNLWELDLYNHYILSQKTYGTEGTHFFSRYNGKISLRLDSLEETYIVANFFKNLKFKLKINIPNYSDLEIKKVYHNRFGCSINNSEFLNAFEIIIYIKSKKDYFKFREGLIELRDMNFYTNYWDGDSGIYGDGKLIIN